MVLGDLIPTLGPRVRLRRDRSQHLEQGFIVKFGFQFFPVNRY